MTSVALRPRSMPLFVYKTADETVNNSTTFQDDNHLVFAVGAHQLWVVRYVLFATCTDATADMKVLVTAPAGATVTGGLISARATDSVATSVALAGTLGVAATVQPAIVEASVDTDATAGNVTLQWAQNTLVVANTILKAGSHLQATLVG